MRILLDECKDERFRKAFPDHDCQTVDQNVAYQQNLAKRRIALVILCAPTNRRRDLEPLLPTALEALATIKPGDLVRIGKKPLTRES
jgi:hypothetical protein